MRRVFASLLFVAVVAADRLTKFAALRLPEPGPFSFGNVLTTTHHHNFGLLANFPLPLIVIYAIVGVVIVFVIIALADADRRKNLFDLLALSLILAGAIGNLWDRIAWGYVFDWILVFHTSIINLADIAIGLGLLLYVVSRGRATKAVALDTGPKTP